MKKQKKEATKTRHYGAKMINFERFLINSNNKY